MDAPLFYRAMPTRTYEYVSADNHIDRGQMGRGTKALRAKDRLTLVLCCNATGSSKVRPLLIGTAANPHCFREEACPIPYVGQKNAWMDRVVFRHWWNKVFAPYVRSSTREPVALIMDGCSGHDGTIVDDTDQITISFSHPTQPPFFNL